MKTIAQGADVSGEEGRLSVRIICQLDVILTYLQFKWRPAVSPQMPLSQRCEALRWTLR